MGAVDQPTDPPYVSEGTGHHQVPCPCRSWEDPSQWEAALVDEGVAPLVLVLNLISGIVTYFSCQDAASEPAIGTHLAYVRFGPWGEHTLDQVVEPIRHLLYQEGANLGAMLRVRPHPGGPPMPNPFAELLCPPEQLGHLVRLLQHAASHVPAQLLALR